MQDTSDSGVSQVRNPNPFGHPRDAVGDYSRDTEETETDFLIGVQVTHRKPTRNGHDKWDPANL